MAARAGQLAAGATQNDLRRNDRLTGSCPACDFPVTIGRALTGSPAMRVHAWLRTVAALAAEAVPVLQRRPVMVRSILRLTNTERLRPDARSAAAPGQHTLRRVTPLTLPTSANPFGRTSRSTTWFAIT